MLLAAPARCYLGGEHRALAGAASRVLRRRARTVAGAGHTPSPNSQTRPGDATLFRRTGACSSASMSQRQSWWSVSSPSGERFSVANDERGVRTLVERMRSIGAQLIVLEATGGYELLGVAALV